MSAGQPGEADGYSECSKERAIAIAEDYTRKASPPCQLDGPPIEKSYGWVFALEPVLDDEGDPIAGIGPFIVTKADGAVHRVPSMPSAREEFLHRFNEQYG